MHDFIKKRTSFAQIADKVCIGSQENCYDKDLIVCSSAIHFQLYITQFLSHLAILSCTETTSKQLIQLPDLVEELQVRMQITVSLDSRQNQSIPASITRLKNQT